ncbi:hypothetical protein OGAPHI_005147 [Ogataea philodendri]|uniref:Uncharacterized protein n=1 Tax=Ogataea philodendri TaxID=1378263 RepID=A0A9P8P255_9ASCO|nr:uncharacterized protein OGAPHI_005147 [Ogataea philodendri]KAH3663745.1 hypothetical protein OGAPHI_005147 [Ogataea philodendri]
MEESVVTDTENFSQVVVVVDHHAWFWLSFGDGHQSVDVLNRAERLLPELQSNGNVQLVESGLEVSLQSVRVREIDWVFYLVLKAECLRNNSSIAHLELGVVSQNVQNSSVCLPQELQPWNNKLSVGTVLGVVCRNTGHEHVFWRNDDSSVFVVFSIFVIFLELGSFCLQSGSNVVSLQLGIVQLGFGLVKELFHHSLNRLETILVSLNVLLVLVQTVLDKLTTSELHAQINKQKSNWLKISRNHRSGSFRADKVTGLSNLVHIGPTEDPYNEIIPPNELKFWQRQGAKRRKNIPEQYSANDRAILKSVRDRAYYQDTCFSIAGIRWGCGAIVGLVPVAGDVINVAISVELIRKANQIDGALSSPVVVKMIINVIIDFLIGLIPIVGDFITIAYKANTRNFQLLDELLVKRYSAVLSKQPLDPIATTN